MDQTVWTFGMPIGEFLTAADRALALNDTRRADTFTPTESLTPRLFARKRDGVRVSGRGR